MSWLSDLNEMTWARIKNVLSLQILPAPLRKLIIAIIGGTILLIGIALLVLPGPAFVVIPVGLAILATEFAWARRAVKKARPMVAEARGREEKKT